MFEPVLGEGMLRIAREKGALDLHVHDLRDWTHDVHRTVDDTPYGGGAGMLLKVDVLVEAIEAVAGMDALTPYVVFLTPAGRTFSQGIAGDYAQRERLLLVCGRYEGFDERAFVWADELLSVGDFVLTGGELPAMCVIDAVARLLPGVLGHVDSAVEESFSNGLLEYPQYTRPAEFRGCEVPEVLRSGDHAAVARWRAQQAGELTRRRRPDLLE
jgi:tRNA (guanine37-N1)-methyltransferase